MYCSSLSQRQFCPILNRGADQLFSKFSVWLLAVPEAVLSHTTARSRPALQSILYVAPRCPRGSLVPYQNEEQISCAVHSLCCSSLFQRQSRTIPKQGESVPLGPSFVRNGSTLQFIISSAKSLLLVVSVL